MELNSPPARKRLISQPRRPGQPHRPVVSAKIDRGVLAAVDAEAERRGVSRSAFVSDAISAHVKAFQRMAGE